MTLFFITGNEGKLREAKAILGNVENVMFDLPEIQSLDPQEIIKAKLEEAMKNHSGEFFVEDTSVHLDCLNGLPGPLIKWFLESLGDFGLAQLAQKHENQSATARTVIGYSNGARTEFFEGTISGSIVMPRGEGGFGWDKIFLPDGYSKTLGEMTSEEKNTLSMRKVALEKMRDWLEKER